MPELEDTALLREYLERDSEVAFARLVARHVHKVYSVALRHTGNPHSAEEITQAVFAILARKSRHLGRRVILSGWLYQTARLTAVTFIRGEIRRAGREKEAHLQTVVNEKESEVWPEIAPLLDAAMAGLKESDRHAVVLRYFDGKSLREVGAALGSNEEAAKKRVNRALEKLRQFFAKHGVSSTTAVIAAVVAANSVQAAPAVVAESAGALALAQGAAAGGSISIVIQETLKLMAWTKLKFSILAGAGILLASGTAIVAVETLGPAAFRQVPSPGQRAGGAVAANPDAAADKIWNLYFQAFNLGLTGPAASEAVIQVMTNHPPAALIRLTQMPRRGRQGTAGAGKLQGVGTVQGHVSMGAYLVEVLRYAYDLDPQFPQNRIIVPDELSASRFDFVDTLPHGGRQALQRALKEQFGVAARREIRENLKLTVQNPAAGGLHPHTNDGAAAGFRSSNMTMAEVAGRLAKLLGVDVTDQTGLAGGFDFTLTLPPPRGGTADEIKAAVLDQLGLGLVPAADNQPVEFLVAEVAK